MSVEKDIRARLGAEIDALKKDMRTGHSPQTLGEHVAWEREFGAEFDTQFPGRATPRMRVEFCKSLARQCGLPYATVKAAFHDVWVARQGP